MYFLSRFQNRIDKKGRISVPAQFRTVLAAQIKVGDFDGIVAYQSPLNECIEACSMARIMKINERMEGMDPYSQERDAFLTTFFGGAAQLSFDGEGRVMLPDYLIEAAHLSDQAIFVGKGEIFEIWKPESFAAYEKQAQKIAHEKRLMWGKPQ